MKKFLATALAVCMTISLAACGSSAQGNEPAAESSAAVSSEAGTEAAAETTPAAESTAVNSLPCFCPFLCSMALFSLS